MKKEDIYSYLKILGSLLIISPLYIAFFSLDFGIIRAIFITTILYIIQILIFIPLFNYLQYGKFRYLIKNKI